MRRWILALAAAALLMPVEANDHLDNLLERASQQLNRAEFLEEPRALEEARAAIDAALKLTPEHFSALRLRVRQLAIAGDLPAARELSLALNKQMPDDLEVRWWLVYSCRRMKRMEEAERAAQWMLDLRPEDPRSLLAAVDLRIDAGQFESALRVCLDLLVRAEVGDAYLRLAVLDRTAAAYAGLERAELAGKARAAAAQLRVQMKGRKPE